MNSWLCMCGFGEAVSSTFESLFESDGDSLSDLLNVSSWLLLMLYVRDWLNSRIQVVVSELGVLRL